MSTRKLEVDDLLMPYPGFVYLKSGGQKAVFRIDHPVFGVAVLKIGQVDSPDSLQRMEREVDLLKEIESEFYPKHYDFKLETDDRFTILEEYVDAPALSTCLDKFPTTRSALTLISEIIEGLQVLWSKRVVHRDLKPDNILILPSLRPKIIDLGIARLLDATSLTATFALVIIPSEQGKLQPVAKLPANVSAQKLLFPVNGSDASTVKGTFDGYC